MTSMMVGKGSAQTINYICLTLKNMLEWRATCTEILLKLAL